MSTPAVPEELATFVERAKGIGIVDADLIALLKQHGWSERRAYAALSLFYAQRFGAIPERGGAIESARDAFLYLLAFVTLAIWSIALVWLANTLTDWALPSALDSIDRGTGFRQNVAGQLASLIVAFPIFIAVSAAIVRETVPPGIRGIRRTKVADLYRAGDHCGDHARRCRVVLDAVPAG